jgi:hypothetical protein
LRTQELKRDTVLKQKLIALYPLLPLMREQPGETPEKALQTTITAIEEVAGSAFHADLLAIISILAEKRYTAALV